MSDQPQQWTPKTVKDLLGDESDESEPQYFAFDRVAHAHNAALDAEQQKTKQVTEALQKLMKAVQLKMFAGVPEIKTVDDLITAMRTVAQKLMEVSQ